MAGKRIAVFSLFALVALALTVFASSGTEAGTYKAGLDYSLAGTGAGDNENTLNQIIIPIPDYNYEDSSMFTFVPIDGWAATGDTMLIGAKVGDLSSKSTVGLLNGKCASHLTPGFAMHNASVDTSDVIPPGSATDPPGTNSMYFLLKNKYNDPVPMADGDPNLPDYLEGYPHFLNEMFDPDGPCDETGGADPNVCEPGDTGWKLPLQPQARYAGYNGGINNMNIVVQIVVFGPGQLAELGGIYAQMGSGIGSPSLVVLNNPVSQEEAPGAISDFCTPLETTTTLYDFTEDSDYGVGGVGDEFQRNPEADTGVLGTGTHIARNYSRSERDADGDSFENDLDPCPYTDDTGWDPRADLTQAGYDSDGDGLPDTCDPDPTGDPAGDVDPYDCPGSLQTDCDGDGYDNRQDICPLVANGCATLECNINKYNPAWDNQADSDSGLPNANFGPGPDSIGDACDDSDNDGTEDGVGAAPGSGNCTDGQDNDADTLVDVLDPDCTGYEDAGDPQAGSCWDNVDNDSTDGTDWDDATCIATAIFFDNGELKRGTDPWGDNPSTGLFLHTMPWSAVCVGETDTDGDGYCDDLETTLGSPTDDGPETICDETEAECIADPASCDNDGDTYINDGCPVVGYYTESGTAECGDGVTLNTVSDDTAIADSCPDIPTNDGPDCTESVITSDLGAVNDGCPAIGVPESLVIDVTIQADIDGDTQVDDAVAQSCSDGIDNDGDTDIDDADTDANGCDPATYNPDLDLDGVEDSSDNCPDDGAPHGDTWNSEQTNTDKVLSDGGGTMGNPPAALPSDLIGDVCDPDDDNDLYADSLEWWMGTDPDAHCPEIVGLHDAWPLDQNSDRVINLTKDAIKYAGGTIGTLVSDDWSYRRLDLNGDGVINLTKDAIKYAGAAIGSACTP